MISDPRFPIGKFHYDGPPAEDQRRSFIGEIANTPAALRAAVRGLLAQQLDPPIATVVGQSAKWFITFLTAI